MGKILSILLPVCPHLLQIPMGDTGIYIYYELYCRVIASGVHVHTECTHAHLKARARTHTHIFLSKLLPHLAVEGNLMQGLSLTLSTIAAASVSFSS